MPENVYNKLMDQKFVRTEMLLGKQAMETLAAKRVAVFGVGGVGGYVVEALVRSGVGTIDVIDNDEVVVSNLNRQIIATVDQIGKDKVDVIEERALSINPDVRIIKHKCFYLPEKRDEFEFDEYDYIVDAIDTVTAKIDLAVTAQQLGVPVISAMGCGNRLDPSKLTVTDIYKTVNDPLAKIMRHELRKRGVRKLKVVYSTELPLAADQSLADDSNRRSVPGSAIFVPAAAGLMIASEVVRDLIAEGEDNGC